MLSIHRQTSATSHGCWTVAQRSQNTQIRFRSMHGLGLLSVMSFPVYELENSKTETSGSMLTRRQRLHAAGLTQPHYRWVCFIFALLSRAIVQSVVVHVTGLPASLGGRISCTVLGAACHGIQFCHRHVYYVELPCTLFDVPYAKLT